jgi:hypothetical protein
VFPAFDGASTSYIAANFNNTGDLDTISDLSNLLLEPVVTCVTCCWRWL